MASSQFGVVSRPQLLDLGLSRDTIRHAVRAGRLLVVHRGVYAVGHAALSQEGRWLAAVLAAGPDAVLSHRSAASLWRLAPRSPVVVEVTTTGKPRRIERVRVHRTRRLDAHERTRWRGVPVTTPVRTLVDLADEATEDELQRVLHQAEILFSLGARELSAARADGRKAATRLRGPRDRSRSELERAFRRLCETHGIEAPENNVRIAGLEVDFVWRVPRVVVELDGWRFHRSRHAFELDRRRDARLEREGWRVLRFTYRQVTECPHEVVATVRAALASAA